MSPLTATCPPGELEHWRAYAMDRGFRHVESGPLVRSSYHAEKQVDEANRHTDGVLLNRSRPRPVSIEKEKGANEPEKHSPATYNARS